jgi:hypothetical protein
MCFSYLFYLYHDFFCFFLPPRNVEKIGLGISIRELWGIFSQDIFYDVVDQTNYDEHKIGKSAETSKENFVRPFLIKFSIPSKIS